MAKKLVVCLLEVVDEACLPGLPDRLAAALKQAEPSLTLDRLYLLKQGGWGRVEPEIEGASKPYPSEGEPTPKRRHTTTNAKVIHLHDHIQGRKEVE